MRQPPTLSPSSIIRFIEKDVNTHQVIVKRGTILSLIQNGMGLYNFVLLTQKFLNLSTSWKRNLNSSLLKGPLVCKKSKGRCCWDTVETKIINLNCLYYKSYSLSRSCVGKDSLYWCFVLFLL